MRILAIEHEADAGIGVFAEPIAAHGFELEIWRPHEVPEPPTLDGFAGAIPLGGAMNVGETEQHPWIETEVALLREALERGTHLLGVCLGSQMLVAAAGSAPTLARDPEIGWFDVELTSAGRKDALLSAMPAVFEAFQWHSFQAPLPPGAVELASSPACPQAYRIGDSAWGIQFHAEVTPGDALQWTAHHESDPDFARQGLDPGALSAQIRQRSAAWNDLGRVLCDRFCDLVATGAASTPA